MSASLLETIMGNEEAVSITELLPHDAPMILLDKLVSCGHSELVAEVHIGLDSVFADANGDVPAWIGIEYMAQAVAALAGMRTRNNHLPPPIGLLLGTRKYLSSVDKFSNRDILQVSVKSEYEQDDGLSVFDCMITCDHVIATAKINVYQPSPDELMRLLG